jgi:CheY-like chemotaxis protein
MDIQMPNKNGYEATREIAYCLMGSKFQLYLTAGIMIDEKEKCFESGNDYLSKPITVSDLEKY